MPPARILPDIPPAIFTRAGLRFEQCVVQNIPLLCCSREAERRQAPVLFFLPGFEPVAPENLEQLIRFVENGYDLIIVSQSRRSLPAMDIESNSPTGRDRRLLARQWQVYISRAARDISALVDHFCHQPGCDTSRLGMLGASVGGLVAYRALLTDARIKLALVLVPRPSLPHMELADAGENLLPISPDILPARSPAHAGRPAIPAVTGRSRPARAPQQLNFIVPETPDDTGCPSWMKALEWIEYNL
jgi:pimeloyl-ACP methyl ester carboxylesterase